MLGAIIGDIAGSRFEWNNYKTKNFDLLTMECRFTDDTVMSVAICDALMSSKRDMSDLGHNAVKSMQAYGRKYPSAGYGGSFREWIISVNPKPYNSWGSVALQPICYGTMIFTCSLLEKILRLFYTDRVKQKTYVPVENATLGQLLNENNKETVAVFGDIHVRHLTFFLLKTGDKKIGHNYRNRLAHWSDMKNSMLTVSLVAEMLWLFVDIMNTVFFYYLQRLSDSAESIKEV